MNTDTRDLRLCSHFTGLHLARCGAGVLYRKLAGYKDPATLDLPCNSRCSTLTCPKFRHGSQSSSPSTGPDCSGRTQAVPPQAPAAR